MNANMIKGLKMIKEGLTTLIDEASATQEAGVNQLSVATPAMEVPAEADETPVSTEDVSTEEIDAMSFSELKAFAKELGVTAKGTKAQIANAVKTHLLETSAEVDAEDVAEVTEEEPKAKAKVGGKKKEAPAPEDEEDKLEEDPLYAEVVEATADMTLEELAEALDEVGVSSKGKRQALVAKVYEAVKDGLIDIGGEEEEEEEPEEEVKAPAKKAASKKAKAEKEESPEEDPLLDPSKMTVQRKKAVQKFRKETTAAFEKDSLAVEDMEEFLEGFGTKLSKKATSEVILAAYIDAVSRLICDEGNINEEGAYMLNGTPACCGAFLEPTDEEGTYKCQKCGEEYEIDDEE